MPEYLAPGVYVEETSFRSKSIEGVSTTTTGFVGPTLYGPLDEEPEILTSLVDFERTFGGGQQLRFAADDAWLDADPQLRQPPETTAMTNDMWQAVRAFFENGGARLYVKRVYRGIPIDEAPEEGPDGRERDDGRASVRLDAPGGSALAAIRIAARYPGLTGARVLRLGLEVGQNVLSSVVDEGVERSRLGGVLEGDVVILARDVYDVDSPPGSPPERGAYRGTEFAYALLRREDGPDGEPEWRFELALSEPAFGPDGSTIDLGDLEPDSDRVSVVTVSITDLGPDGMSRDTPTWSGLPPDPGHQRFGVGDSLFERFSANPARRSDRTTFPVIIEPADDGGAIANGVDLLRVLFEQFPAPPGDPGDPQNRPWMARRLAGPRSSPAERSRLLRLVGGSDGLRPAAADYVGREDAETGAKLGLVAFEDLEDISIVAAPGSTRDYANPLWAGQADAIVQGLIGHCERMRYRIAVLDAGDRQSVGAVRAMRARLDSKHAALYYPWVVVMDPITQRETTLPPSGFVAGIYARNDRLRAVYKAPANEVVTGALRFETMLNKGQQEVLNPEGINCFRFFEGRGNRLWGARTISSDPEWKYVNLRRYFAYLERSIDMGTQWAVFEPNGELLWGNVRRTIEDFLFNEFQMGALLGDKPEKAFFVKCDRSTMTQNDLDNGRLVCLIGVAPLRPAEFVIFRIGQWTADRKV